MNIALMREVSPRISECEIMNISRTPIDHDIAVAQHKKYAEILQNLGYRIHLLKADDLPDSVFIEDTAVVLDEFAVITHPGAASRRAETEAVAKTLSSYRELLYITPAGTLDGGDVLRIGRTLYVGKSCRSSAMGIIELRELVEPRGYKVKSIDVAGCLHLKSAVSLAAENTLLINPSWIKPDHFEDQRCIPVDPSEPYAANSLFLEDATVYSTAFPRTRRILLAEGINVISLDMSELAKAEGAVTCCSLIFNI